LTVSTDYVFDGGLRTPYSEDDRALPLQAYGTSKRAGELAALASAPESTIVVRTCGLYGYAGSRERLGNFVEKRIAEGRVRDHIEVGSDLTCTPTSASAFANAVFRLIEHREATPGVYHLTAEGACSWAEFTTEILRLAGIECHVEPADRRGDYGRIRRPPYSVLGNRRGAALGIRLPDWTDDLARYVAGR
jgi:dTDP-4-dehydrorhamnose reductase